MSAVKTMNPLLGDLLKHEYTHPNAGAYCRETITIVSGTGALLLGSVLAKITASSKYALHNPGASDGTQLYTNMAVLLENIDATSADVKTGALLRGPALVATGRLVFHANVTAGALTVAALAGLAAANIINRTVA